MPRLPNKIRFECGGCEHSCGIREIRDNLPTCMECGANSWTIVIAYQDVTTGGTGAALVSGLATGVTWTSTTTHSSFKRLEKVPAPIVQKIVEEDSLIGTRVEEYARFYEQQKMRERGAQTCSMCDAMLMPSENKSWTQHGFCSKSCAQQAGAHLEDSSTDTISEFPKVKELSAVCENGHRFMVPVTYSGCLRPCPECRAKTPIP